MTHGVLDSVAQQVGFLYRISVSLVAEAGRKRVTRLPYCLDEHFSALGVFGKARRVTCFVTMRVAVVRPCDIFLMLRVVVW